MTPPPAPTPTRTRIAIAILPFAFAFAPAPAPAAADPAPSYAPSSAVRVADDPDEADQGFVPLFDGATLDGWERFGGKPGHEGVWKVEGGRIVMDGEGGGWIAPARDYGDFELVLEYRLAPGSNSGVYLRAPADASHISRTGMEIQILDDPHPRYADIQPWQRCGSLYHVAPAVGAAEVLKPAGEWNRLRVRLRGPELEVFLNDRRVVQTRLDAHPELEAEHPGLKRTSGRVGLQSHDGRVEFRDIRVKTL